jgi:valyl-tRNA synthetase
LIDAAADAEIGLVIAAVSEGRSVRAELNVPPAARPELLVIEASPIQRDAFERNAAVIGQTLRVSGIRFEAALPQGAIPFMVEGASLALPVAAFIDLPVERARLIKEIAGHEAAIQRAAALAGVDDSTFTMNAAYQAALATIAAHERTALQPVDHAAFFAALDQPPAPTAPLRQAFRRHRQTVTPD